MRDNVKMNFTDRSNICHFFTPSGQLIYLNSYFYRILWKRFFDLYCTFN